MDQLSKPARHREVFFTDKTGGDNNDVDSSGKNVGLSAGGFGLWEHELTEMKQVVLSLTTTPVD